MSYESWKDSSDVGFIERVINLLTRRWFLFTKKSFFSNIHYITGSLLLLNYATFTKFMHVHISLFSAHFPFLFFTKHILLYKLKLMFIIRRKKLGIII